MGGKKKVVEISRIELVNAYKRVEEKHLKFLEDNPVSVSSSNETIMVGTVEYAVTPWSILMELIMHFISSYMQSGKVKFSFWSFGKNFQTVVKLIRFIKSVKKLF